jgi:hypothetical protein
MINENHLNFRLMLQSQFRGFALVLLSCIIVQCVAAQSQDWRLVTLDDLNTSSDEVLVGWDGESLFSIDLKGLKNAKEALIGFDRVNPIGSQGVSRVGLILMNPIRLCFALFPALTGQDLKRFSMLRSMRSVGFW